MPDSPRLRLSWLPAAGLVALCLASSVTGLGNHFSQDDMPVIQWNPAVHSLREPTTFFTQSYWPKPFPPGLYRPLASAGFAVQWVLSGGRPWLFRAVSILMYVAAGLALWRLAALLLPPGAAWLAAAFFMVHPVHVEAVAVSVNQSEIMVGLLFALAAALYLRLRARAALDLASGAGLFALYLVACLYKESALVLPGILVAAELTVVRDPRPLRQRLADVRPLLLVMALGAVCFFAMRTWALGGDVVGTFKAEALVGSMGRRALTMLGVVPHWFRLLLWPAHLQGDYSPREIEAATGWGDSQTQGAALLAGAILLAILAWRRQPVVTFGLLWVAIALFPVSNVLVPTGIAMAERTLFLPSVGMMLVVGGLAAPVIAACAARPRSMQALAAAVPAAILVMGASRSASRQRVWQDQFRFWYQTTIDAPLSYRAHHALAQLLYKIGQRRSAEHEYHLAIALYPETWGPAFDLAQRYRLSGLCEPAVILYHRTLGLDPTHEAARSSLIACLLHLGRYPEAGQVAREGIRYGSNRARVRVFQKFLGVADSALAAKAQPGTVTINILASDSAEAAGEGTARP